MSRLAVVAYTIADLFWFSVYFISIPYFILHASSLYHYDHSPTAVRPQVTTAESEGRPLKVMMTTTTTTTTTTQKMEKRVRGGEDDDEQERGTRTTRWNSNGDGDEPVTTTGGSNERDDRRLVRVMVVNRIVVSSSNSIQAMIPHSTPNWPRLVAVDGSELRHVITD
jgi:hypothetical protein